MDEEDRLIERFLQHEIEAEELLRSLAGLRRPEERAGRTVDLRDPAGERRVPTPQAAMAESRRPADGEGAGGGPPEYSDRAPDSIVQAREALRRLDRYRR